LDNIRVIQTGLDVSKIKNELELFPQDWGIQTDMAHAEMLDPTINLVSAKVLQLVVGAVRNANEDARNSELCIPTPACGHHTEILRWAWKTFGRFARCAFLSLPVGKIVGKHIDEGTYYLTKDRYHLSIQGRYRYSVGDESVIVEPGTFLWFNNKLPHGTENIGDETRITFVIDVPHDPKNP
jgi:hypothetical protein